MNGAEFWPGKSAPGLTAEMPFVSAVVLHENLGLFGAFNEGLGNVDEKICSRNCRGAVRVSCWGLRSISSDESGVCLQQKMEMPFDFSLLVTV